MLAVHGTAEEMVVHPYMKRVADGGDELVTDRLGEEKTAKQALSVRKVWARRTQRSCPGCSPCARTCRRTPARRSATSSPCCAA
ncbi:hypothetical protein [Streptomyces sp. NPDC018045]|uniref:hypothetical protein n=1 Tax=Streptomyces sp. NPDC018045 TaxID=3365037 RepID=UPI0037972C3E